MGSEEPPADDPTLVSMMRFMLSGLDVQTNQTHNIEAVKANKPSPLIKPIFTEAYFILDDCIEKGTKQVRYLILLAKWRIGYVNRWY